MFRLRNQSTSSTSNSQADVLRLRLGSGDKVLVSLERAGVKDTAPAWAIPNKCLEQAIQQGCQFVEVQDTETGVVVRASVKSIEGRGTPLADRDALALPAPAWLPVWLPHGGPVQWVTLSANTGAPGPGSDTAALLQAAKDYGAAGFPVVHLVPGKKVPRLKGGYKSATTNQAAIAKLWADYPTANVGIATGEKSGLLVVDVDPRHGGEATMRQWQSSGWLPDDTPRARSAHGGWHFYFRLPEKLKNAPSKRVADGVDIKANGGYIVAPPSKLADGGQYSWEVPLSQEALREPPPGLTEFLAETLWARKRPAAGQAPPPAQGRNDAELLPIPEGSRNMELTRLAGKLRADGLSVKAIQAALQVVNQERCQPPLPEDEVQRIAQSIGRYRRGGANPQAAACGLCPEVEPWPEPVDGPSLFAEVVECLQRYLVLPDGAAVAMALWAAHTFCVNAFSHSPRLHFHSPMQQCGKTTALKILSCLSEKPMLLASLTSAGLFRAAAQDQPTLFIDEAQSLLSSYREDLEALLKSGYDNEGGAVLRVEEVGGGGLKRFAPKLYRCYCAVAFAGIGQFTGSLAPLADRCITIRMQRATPAERKQRFDSSRQSQARQELLALQRKLARWCLDHRQQIEQTAALPDIQLGLPEDAANRQADKWRPLFTVARVVGPEWTARCLASYHALEAARPPSDQAPIQVQLLAAIKDIFDHRPKDRIASQELAQMLAEREGEPWADFNQGRPITPNQLANQLRPLGICPKTIRIGQRSTAKGYEASDFQDAWARYLP
jgi:hypothetical protein